MNKEVSMIHNPSYPCSCNVNKNGKSVSIQYCPIHDAAPKLLLALKQMVYAFNVEEIDPLVAFMTIEKARHAIETATAEKWVQFPAIA